jgi:hypothetical protein
MSRKNAKNVAASQIAKEERRAKREALEPFQKLLNTKSSKCRSILGMLLYQNDEVRNEIFETMEELKKIGM